MIKKSFNCLVVCILFVFTLYLIQGACFRFVETYAKMRLSLAWGKENSLQPNSFLRKFPLDHFAEPPPQEDFKDFLSLLDGEVRYANQVMSFSRPIRDRYYNFVDNLNNPLGRFEIGNLGMVKEVVKPGLRRLASSLDVTLGLVRREGLLVDFSKALFVRVMSKSSREDYEKEFSKWESTFAFLAEEGIASVLMEVDNDQELISKLNYLQNQQPNFAKNLLLYSDNQAVAMVESARRNENLKIKCVLLKNPTEEIQPLSKKPMNTWLLGIMSHTQSQPKVLSSIIRQVRIHRDSPYLYNSKLAGLLYLDKEKEGLPLSPFSMSYILVCLDFNQNEEMHPGMEIIDEFNSTEFDQSKDLKEYSMEIPALVAEDENNSSYEPNFDCPIIREYRVMHSGSTDLENVSNRDIVLNLGSSFEQMGENVLLQVADKDPLFYRYYLSLKEIQKNQN